MEERYKSTLLLIALLACPFLIGWTASWEEIKKASGNIKSVSAEFVQEKHMKILAKPLKSYGKFYFSAPDSLRWEYTSPIKSILMMHKGKIKRYIKGHSGYIEDSSAKLQAMQIVMQEITAWLNGRYHDSPSFTAALKSGPKAKIVLTPRQEAIANIIKRIELRLSRKLGIINSVLIYENKDSYTLLEFKKELLNKKIDESLFMEI